MGKRDRSGAVYRAFRRQAPPRPRLGRERGAWPRQHLYPATSHRQMSSPDRILIVEDEQHLAEGLRFNLEAEGYQVKAVETGEAALELLIPENHQPAFDLVVLDVMLPVKDG